MKIKKAFTLIELLIVISIVGMLIYSMRWLFSYKNVERVKFDTCYIHTYSKLGKFMQDAILQKMYFSWTSYKKPLLYEIRFDIPNNKLLLSYSWENDKYVESINFSGVDVDNVNDCFTKTYHTKLSWDDLKIDILPWLQADINDSPVKMYTWDTNLLPVNSSWTVFMYFCQWNMCLDKYKFTFIPSTYLLITSYCMKRDTNTLKCIKWSE